MRKTITISAFSIGLNTATTKKFNCAEDILKALKNFNTIQKRFMVLNPMDSIQEGDFIAMYQEIGNLLFGLFIRMKGGELAHILKDHLSKPAISFTEIAKEAEENVAGIVQAYSYFLCNNKVLIYMPGGLTIKSFQTYISWLLSKERTPNNYIFNPILKKQGAIPIKDVKEIIIADSFFYNVATNKTVTKYFNLFRKDLLKQLINNSDDLADIDEENIISAKIELKFNTKKIDKEKRLTAAIKSIDQDDIIIKDKSGKTIKGSEYIEKRVEKIETTKAGFPIEEQVKQIMVKFFNELVSIKE